MVKWLTRRIVAPLFEGSNPSSHPINFILLGRSQVGKAPDFDSGMRWFESSRPSHYDPLAQSVEHLTFNQGVVGSSPTWVTIFISSRAWRNGRRGRLRICCRKVWRFKSSRPHHFISNSKGQQAFMHLLSFFYCFLHYQINLLDHADLTIFFKKDAARPHLPLGIACSILHGKFGRYIP